MDRETTHSPKQWNQTFFFSFSKGFVYEQKQNKIWQSSNFLFSFFITSDLYYKFSVHSSIFQCSFAFLLSTNKEKLWQSSLGRLSNKNMLPLHVWLRIWLNPLLSAYVSSRLQGAPPTPDIVQYQSNIFIYFFLWFHSIAFIFCVLHCTGHQCPLLSFLFFFIRSVKTFCVTYFFSWPFVLNCKTIKIKRKLAMVKKKKTSRLETMDRLVRPMLAIRRRCLWWWLANRVAGGSAYARRPAVSYCRDGKRRTLQTSDKETQIKHIRRAPQTTATRNK